MKRFGFDIRTAALVWLLVGGVLRALPPEVTLNSPEDVLRTALTLTWSRCTSSDFSAYLVYRALHAGVTTADTLVAEITDPADTTFRDTPLHAGTRYYYRVFLRDAEDSLTTGSNEVSAQTLPNTYPFVDSISANSLLNFVETEGSTWGVTSEDAHSPPYCLTVAPEQQYAPSADQTLDLRVSFVGAYRPVITFWERHSTEDGGDFCYLEVSGDNGNTWTRVFSATGASDWRRVRVDLSPWAGTVVLIRFRLKADADGYTGAGWFLDDITVAETDVAGPIALPLRDNVEDSATRALWIPSVWQPVTGQGLEGSTAWCANPEGHLGLTGDYCLTLGHELDLLGHPRPEIRFFYRGTVPHLEVSQDHGVTWTSLPLWSTSKGTFQRALADLSSYGDQRVRIRFRFHQGGTALLYLDEILVKEAPGDVPLEPASEVTSHSARLTWHPYTGGDFAAYELRRSTEADITWDDPVIATFTDPQETTFVDNDLQANSTYSYRVFVVDTTGMKSLGSNEITVSTPFVVYQPYPFSDDVEGDTSHWVWDAPWGVTTEDAHSGTRAWEVAPGTHYTPNLDRSLYLGVDLSGSLQPTLYFWSRTSIPDKNDHGYIEISANDGQTWRRVYHTTGVRAWHRVALDLSEWRGYGPVVLRFRFVSDGDGDVGNGWFIDDVEVKETEVAGPLAYPFFDDVEDSATRALWLPSSWVPMATEGLHNSTAWAVNPEHDAGDPAHHACLTLGNDLDLTSASHPQAQFYYKKWGGDLYLEVSLDHGHTWTPVWTGNNTSSYQRTQVDLSPYAGHQVRLRFRDYFGSIWTAYLDNLRVQEAPADVALEEPTEITSHSARLTWHPYTGGDFVAYELRRSTESGVSWEDEVVATLLTHPEDTTFLDSLLYANTTYYYRVFVVDTADLRSLGSNEVSVTTRWLTYADYPLEDDLENPPGPWWAWDGTWGLTTGFAHSGNHAWNESPTGDYPSNADWSLYLGINLSAASLPVLSFYEYTSLGSGDVGRIEVSTDHGTSWTRIYETRDIQGWHRVRIDLTPYAPQSEVLLRFHFTSNNDASTGNGWFIDDIQIQESPVPVLSYPFFDDGEDTSVTRLWLASSARIEEGTGLNNSHAWFFPPYFAYYTLTLGNDLDLSEAVHPRIAFWIQGSGLRLELSTNHGHTWTEIWPGRKGTPTRGFVSVSLEPYAGSTIRLRFRHIYGAAAYPARVDHFQISEDYSQYQVPDTARILGPDTLLVSVGMTTDRVYAVVFEPGITDQAGQGEGLLAQIGFGPEGTFPWDTSWHWSSATYDGDQGTLYDRYWGTVSPTQAGTYRVAFRFSADTGRTWIYADLDGNDLGAGGYNGFTPSYTPFLQVTLLPVMHLSRDSLAFQVREGEGYSAHLTVSNTGEGPLYLTLRESTTGTTPEEVAWLSVSPFHLYVEPGQQAEITVTTLADTLKPDTTYLAYLWMESNDPSDPLHTLPVTLTVLDSTVNVLRGILVDPNGQPVHTEGLVQVYSGTTLLAEVQTDGLGQFQVVGLDSGTYDLRAAAPGFFPSWLHGVTNPGQGLQVRLSPVPEPVPTPYKVDVYGTATFQGEPVKPGDVILAFDPDGVLCGVFYVQTEGQYGFLHVYGDDPTTPEDEGCDLYDPITLLVNEYPAQTLGPEYAVWNGNNNLRHVNLAAVAQDTVPLTEGWNLMSFTVFPEDSAIETVLAPILSHVVRVSGFDQAWGGARTYDPTLPGYSDLHTLDPYHGYWIKLTQADTLVVSGARLHSSWPLPLEAGWNLTSYLPEVTESVAVALRSLQGNIAIVSGFDGGAQTYVPGSEYNDLFVMNNGFGYWIRTFTADTLVYSQAFVHAGNQGKAPAPAGLAHRPATPKGHRDGVVPTPYWTDYYGTLSLNGSPAPVGTVVQVLDPDGVLCGEFVVHTPGQYGFLHVYGDDPTTPEDEGAQPGDSLVFWCEGQVVGVARDSLAWTGDRRIFRLDLAPLQVAEGPAHPRVFALRPVHPNPAAREARVTFTVPQKSPVTLLLYDAAGRQVATLWHQETQPGVYTLPLPLHQLTNGVYFLQMDAPNFHRVRKFVVLR